MPHGEYYCMDDLIEKVTLWVVHGVPIEMATT